MPVEYLGTGNDDGVALGRSSTDKVAFHNATPIAKTACTLSAAITAGATIVGLSTAYAELYAALAAKGIIG